MAIEKIVLQYEADVKKLKGDLKKAEKGLGAVEKKGKQSAKAVTKSFGGLRASIVKVGAALAAAFAVQKLISFGKESLRLFDIQAKSETKLLVALKGREDIQARLIDQAKELQKITLFGDEVIIEAQAFLATMGLQEDAIKRLTPLVLDLATKQNLDLRSASDLIAKSVGSSTNALSRYGIVIEGAVGSTERMESAVTALNRQVGGQAEAAAKVGTGALIQFQNRLSDLQEEIGKGINVAISKLVGFGTELLDNLGLLGAAIKAIATPFEQFANVLSRAAASMGLINEQTTLGRIVIETFVFIIERAAFVPLLLIKSLLKLTAVFSGFQRVFTEGIANIRETALTGLRDVGNLIVGVFTFDLSLIKSSFASLSATVKQQGKEVATAFVFGFSDEIFKQQMGMDAPKTKSAAAAAEVKAKEIGVKVGNAFNAGMIEAVDIRKSIGKEVKKTEQEIIDERVKAAKEGVDRSIIEFERESAKRKRIFEDEQAFKRQVEDEAFALTGVTADAIREISRNNADFELGVLRDKLESGAISQSEFDDKAKKIKTRQAKAEKNNALFGIALSTAQAVIKAVQASPATFGLPFSAFALATGAIQAAAVNSRAIPKFSKGVISIDGAGNATSDSIPSLLSRGESVMTAGETMKHKDALLAIRGDYMDRYINQNYVIPMLQKQSQGGNNVGAAMFDDFGIIRQLKKNSRVSSRNTGALAKQIGREVANNNYFNDRY